MQQIRVAYPNGIYKLNVTDECEDRYQRLLVTEGERSANVYGRSLVQAHKRMLKKSAVVTSVVKATTWCDNRECEWCGNEDCTLRHSEQR